MPVSDTVIVGAGPYGLSIAAHLRAAGLQFQLFGTPLESWRAFMPAGMVLKSEAFASNLWDPQRKFTLQRYSTEHKIPYQRSGRPLPLSVFLDYADWFRRRAVGEVSPAKIRRITRGIEDFTLEFEDQPPVRARRVILATGHMAFRYIPPELANIDEPFCLHSSRIGDVRTFRGRDVAILGAGQSAIETAALLHEAGATVTLVARCNRLLWNDPPSNKPHSWANSLTRPESGLGMGWRSWAVSELPQLFRRLFSEEKRHRFVAGSWGPSGAWWLRERFENRFATLLGCRIRSAVRVGERLRLVLEQANGASELETDQVIAGTGFKVDIDRLGFIDPSLRTRIAREAAAPLLDAHFQTSVPGLFIVGVASAPTFGPVMRFMYGAKHVAPVLTRHLAMHGEPRTWQVVAPRDGAASLGSAVAPPPAVKRPAVNE
jgi:thioredoxin reductase